MLRAILCGVVIGVIPLHFRFVALGGGHGTIVPLCTFYGPTSILVLFFGDWLCTTEISDEMVSFLCGACAALAYGIYAAILCSARSRGHGKATLAILAVVHYSASVICIDIWGYAGPERLLRLFVGHPYFFGSCIFLFMLVNMVAFFYAFDRMPKRLQFGLRSLMALTVVCALIFSIFASLQYLWDRIASEEAGTITGEESGTITEPESDVSSSQSRKPGQRPVTDVAFSSAIREIAQMAHLPQLYLRPPILLRLRRPDVSPNPSILNAGSPP